MGQVEIVVTLDADDVRISDDSMPAMRHWQEAATPAQFRDFTNYLIRGLIDAGFLRLKKVPDIYALPKRQRKRYALPFPRRVTPQNQAFVVKWLQLWEAYPGKNSSIEQ